MRKRMVISGVSFMLMLTVATGIASMVAHDPSEERLDELEWRVARLETQVATPTEPSSSDQQSDVTTSSSSQSSSSQSSTTSSGDGETNVYVATYSGNGDQSNAFEIDEGGTYRMYVDGDGPVSVRIETRDGQAIDAFTYSVDADQSLENGGHLEPGAYVLEVEAEGSWSVVITSTGG